MKKVLSVLIVYVMLKSGCALKISIWPTNKVTRYKLANKMEIPRDYNEINSPGPNPKMPGNKAPGTARSIAPQGPQGQLNPSLGQYEIEKLGPNGKVQQKLPVNRNAGSGGGLGGRLQGGQGFGQGRTPGGRAGAMRPLHGRRRLGQQGATNFYGNESEGVFERQGNPPGMGNQRIGPWDVPHGGTEFGVKGSIQEGRGGGGISPNSAGHQGLENGRIPPTLGNVGATRTIQGRRRLSQQGNLYGTVGQGFEMGGISSGMGSQGIGNWNQQYSEQGGSYRRVKQDVMYASAENALLNNP